MQILKIHITILMPSHNVLYARFKIFFSCRLQSLCFKNQIKKSWVLTRQCTSCVLVVILISSEYKQCEKDIKDTIDETQHPTEHLAFIVVHKISAIYRDLNIRRLIQPINTCSRPEWGEPCQPWSGEMHWQCLK